MALEVVPSYLTQAVRIADPERVTRALLTGGDEWLTSTAVLGAAETLGAWADDAEFWNSVAEELPQEVPGYMLQDHFDEEQELLANALDGDHRLAWLVLLDAPLRAARPSPQQARQVSGILQRECHQVAEEPRTRKRAWRAARLLRRVFKAAGGGLLWPPTSSVRIPRFS